MKYFKQLLIILAFSMAGELLAAAVPLPVPAAIYGFVLLFVALLTGALKPEQIDKTADFLIGIMPVLFVAPAVNILSYFDVIAPRLVPIAVVVLVSTVVVFGVSGHVTQWLRKKEDKKNG